MAEEKKPRRLARRVVYENPWVNLYVDRVEFPGGRIVEEHHLIDFVQASVAVVVENARGELLFVEAYRYTTDSIEWEVPAGRMDAGERPLETAAREVWEESGYRTASHELLYTFYSMIGISNAVSHVVTCRAQHQEDTFDTNEVRSVRWFSRDEVYEMIRAQTIRDGSTLNALLLYFALK